MKRVSRLSSIGLAVLLAIAPLGFAQSEDPAQQEQASPPPPPQEPPPVPAPAAESPPAPMALSLGEFAVKVAVNLGLPAPPAGFTSESAAWGLLQRGIRLRAELSSPLTEADAVSILNGLGYRVRTETPSRVMTSDRAGVLLETFIGSSE